METRMKKRWGAALVLALGCMGLARTAGAAAQGVTITITPNAGYSLTLTTTTTGAGNLGVVNLGVSTNTLAPSTVTITSSFLYTGLTLNGAITGGGSHPWTFSSTNTQSTDNLAAWAVFTDTSVTVVPPFTAVTSSDAFYGASAISVGATGGTCPALGAGAAHFELQSGAGIKHMECLLSNQSTSVFSATSFLYLYFTLPTNITDTTSSAQLVSFTLTASGPN